MQTSLVPTMQLKEEQVKNRKSKSFFYDYWRWWNVH